MRGPEEPRSRGSVVAQADAGAQRRWRHERSGAKRRSRDPGAQFWLRPTPERSGGGGMSDDRSWDAHAATFDEEPDHGLTDPAVRSAWAALLASVLPPAPASVVDIGCGTGTLAVLLSEG